MPRVSKKRLIKELSEAITAANMYSYDEDMEACDLFRHVEMAWDEMCAILDVAVSFQYIDRASVDTAKEAIRKVCIPMLDVLDEDED